MSNEDDAVEERLLRKAEERLRAEIARTAALLQRHVPAGSICSVKLPRLGRELLVSRTEVKFDDPHAATIAHLAPGLQPTPIHEQPLYHLPHIAEALVALHTMLSKREFRWSLDSSTRALRQVVKSVEADDCERR